jgi:phosphocarrier protein HPr
VQQKIVIIRNRLGLHARAAARLVRLASGFESRIELSRTDARQSPVDAKSIFGVLLLAATQHTEIEIKASGGDEVEAVAALAGLIDDRLGEA